MVIGEAHNASVQCHAFRWDQGGMSDLGTLGGDYSTARDLSADGEVVVGWATDGRGYNRAFRWSGGEMTDLGTIDGDQSYALAVSADGSTVVGQATTVSGPLAFRWHESTGMLSVAQWLANDGVSVEGWDLQSANGVSANGSVLFGFGVDPEGAQRGWMARTGALIDPIEWLSTVSGVRQVFHTGMRLSNLALHGAHHRPLMSYDQVGQGLGLWVTGDLAGYGDGRDTVSGAGEIGLYNDFTGGRMRAGLGLGYSGQRQDLPLDGSADLDGAYLIGELNWRAVRGPDLIASLTASYGLWNADVKRGYLNGSLVDHSEGDTEVQSASIRIKFDWQDAARLGAMRFDPYAGFTFTHTRVNGYTETNGGVPARFDTQKHDAQELRIGVAGLMAITEAVRLRLTFEGVHRFDNDGPSLSGREVGGFGISFNIPGDDIEQDWVRGGGEVEYAINAGSMIAFSLNGSSEGQDPDISGAITFRKKM